MLVTWHCLALSKGLGASRRTVERPGKSNLLMVWRASYNWGGTFSYHDPLHKTKAENLCKRPGGISFSLNCCFQLVQIFNLHLQQAKHCLAQMRGCEQEWHEWNSYTHCHCKGLKLSDLWTEILFRHLQQLSWDMFEGALNALATLKLPSSSAPSQKSWRGSTIPSFFFQPLGPDRFWKSFVDTFVCAQGESALRASPQAGCCRKTICSLRLTRLVNTQGGRWCRMPKALITVFFNAQILLAKFTISGKKAFVDEGSFENGDSFKIHRNSLAGYISQTASLARRVALRRPGGAAAVFFFFEPRSSGRLNDSKVATCQKVGQCESHTGAAWLFWFSP